jgi:hypothetical protein
MEDKIETSISVQGWSAWDGVTVYRTTRFFRRSNGSSEPEKSLKKGDGMTIQLMPDGSKSFQGRSSPEKLPNERPPL